jgi:hypothetical protein
MRRSLEWKAAIQSWLSTNKPALASVKLGLAPAESGKTKFLGSFAKYAK